MTEVTYKRPKLTLPKKRAWKAAKSSLLESNWLTYSRPIDFDIRYGLTALRARARNEAQNNDHVRHFLRLVKTNVVGRQGVMLNARARTRGGRADNIANTAIEEAWREWGRRGTADVTGQMSWRELQRQCVETVARDGEALYRILPDWDNKFGFALQAIDVETLDVDYNEDLGGGRSVVMGVEFDEWRRPVAYYLYQEERVQPGIRQSRKRTRLLAREILHIYLPEWVWQSRGVPWMATALQRLHMLNGYEDAEVTAARVAATKMGFYEQEATAGQYTGDEEDSKGNPIQDARPGEFEILPEGWSFSQWDPQHPNAGYGDFVKAVLRAVASGLGVNYNTLANDLEGVNYTSLRHGSLTERDVWMYLQDWFVETFCERVYGNWLRPAMLNGAIVQKNGAPYSLVSRLEDFKRVAWQPRRWQWVDPQKEMTANKEAFNLRTRSISDIIREQGRDPDEVWEEIARDKSRMEELGIEMVLEPTPPQQVQNIEDDTE